MNVVTRYKLYRLRRTLCARPQFRQALKNRLTAVSAAQFSQSARPPRRHFRFVMAGALALVLAVCTGTGAYAYQSPEVTVGTPLYPVKKVLEKVEEKLQTTPTKKAEFDLKKIARREEEVTVLERRQKQTVAVEREINKIEKHLADLERVNERAIKLGQSAAITDEKLQQKIKQRLELRVERLEKKEAARKKILEKVRVPTGRFLPQPGVSPVTPRERQKNDKNNNNPIEQREKEVTTSYQTSSSSTSTAPIKPGRRLPRIIKRLIRSNQDR